MKIRDLSTRLWIDMNRNVRKNVNPRVRYYDEYASWWIASRRELFSEISLENLQRNRVATTDAQISYDITIAGKYSRLCFRYLFF